MATMYELIMDLPLFKGVSKDHVSQFLEKTNVGFANYEPGDLIFEQGDDVTMIRFVISGRVKIIHPLGRPRLCVEETCGKGRVLGAERLFGMSTGYSFRALAVGKVSIMEFSKEQYMNLLLSDRIYMLNFFNYLSLRAQRPIEAVSDYVDGDISSRLKILVAVMTVPQSEDIVLAASDVALAEYCGVSVEAFSEWKEQMARDGVIKHDSKGIIIRSRREFLG